MGRYRPPAPKKSPYITPEGLQQLKDEEVAIWKRRRKVVKALSAAAAEGDRSENAEYQYRKKELRELDRRIRYLQKRIPDLIVVNKKPTDTNKVFFGAWVTIEDNDGNETNYRIVGPDEYDLKKNWISMDSPLAKTMLKLPLDGEFTFTHANNTLSGIITNIFYNPE